MRLLQEADSSAERQFGTTSFLSLLPCDPIPHRDSVSESRGAAPRCC
jgi:hypothetical protein